MYLTKCKHLKFDPNYRNPPRCNKMKVDEPESKGLCRKCMFKERDDNDGRSAATEPDPVPSLRGDD